MALVGVTVASLQQQYGTLKRAVLYYLDDLMPPEQQAAFERVVAPEFIAAIAQTRAIEVLAHAEPR